jgi:hypothetical protein
LLARIFRYFPALVTVNLWRLLAEWQQNAQEHQTTQTILLLRRQKLCRKKVRLCLAVFKRGSEISDVRSSIKTTKNMKSLRRIMSGLLIGGGLMALSNLVHAQDAATNADVNSLSDFAVELQALEMTTPMPASELPDLSETHGFYSAQNPDWPPLPADILWLPVWPLGNGMFVLDDTNVNYVELAQSAGGVYSLNFEPQVFTTNDLWLQINSVTNGIMGLTAYLTIHTPWNDTNLTYDLLYTTSLDSPTYWSFLMRCTGTNVIATGLCEGQGFFALTHTNGDLTVSTNTTAQQLAQLLVPPGVVITNATYTGTNVARGTFAGGNGCGLPIDSGVILSSGEITNAIGPVNDDSGQFAGGWTNTPNEGPSNLGEPGDADLSGLVGEGTNYDAGVLQFDIISTNSFTLQFQYIFASEEYPEWIGQYNDPMAIFVSTNEVGTNWINSITNDLALVPGTTNVPVSINTINGGSLGGSFYGEDLATVSPSNAQYYVDNDDPEYIAATNAAPAQEFNIQYDGMTVLLTAQTFISANVTNHVKIAIADYGDHVFDSAVFITAGPIPCN